MGTPLSRSWSDSSRGSTPTGSRSKTRGSASGSTGSGEDCRRDGPRYRNNAIMRIITKRGNKRSEEEVVLEPLSDPIPAVDPLISHHYLMTTITGSARMAPIDEPKRVLDVGASCPVWMMELAEELPNTQFFGLDTKPMPDDVILPLNCTFTTFNLRGVPRIPYPDSHFDYVRHRLLNIAVPLESQQYYINECVRTTAWGGWVEICQSLGSPGQQGEYIEMWQMLLEAAMQERLVDNYKMDNVVEMMEIAGLSDVQSKEYRVPIGDWAGPVGKFCWNCVDAGARDVIHGLSRIGHTSPQSIHELLPRLLQQYNQEQSYVSLVVYTGRKVY
ncbi:hypothetical protein THASP1DRAFT_31292 [Thamnocephalis sphaerospora]|uniref:S-adenosyl-L-methionine-dependent methyltransferase n=1 Tax=Thamnocephalis sphaerospora TaxID=78915 RepID=A0A4P9XNR9_9FUNG|nr:hypothetical protein THASP1DRAFT_31292 [Thamnocephalis sphaerospora]|eukprot:RKP06890.1 hypothetical protein THASP1DRAFT_31292 [Thamnocephalis sphaerospora]